MTANKFWNIIEEGIQSAINATPERSVSRNNLFDIANAAYAVKQSLEFLPVYLKNIESPHACMKFLGYTAGYLFGLNYHRDHPSTPKEHKKRIQNIMDLCYALEKLEEAIYNQTYSKKNKNIEELKDKMRKILEMSQIEIFALLQEEIDRMELVSYLKNINPENRKSYLDNVLEVGKKQRPLAPFILEILKSSL